MFGKILVALLIAAVPATAIANPVPFDPARLEAQLLAGVQRALVTGFDMVDGNRDGFITREEIKVFSEARGLPIQHGMNPGSFDRSDRNKDGKVSRQEFIDAGMASYRSVAGIQR